MFYTMQELMAQIKGWEYIIAVVFLGRERPRLAARGPRHGQAGNGNGTRRPRGARLEGTAGATRCWEARNCSLETRERCPGYVLRPLPCWVANPMVAGERLNACSGCPIYVQGMEHLVKTFRGNGGNGSVRAA